MNRLLLRSLVIATALLIVRPAVAEAVSQIDQEFVPTDPRFEANVGTSNQVDWAQTFMVQRSGTLTGFDIWVERSGTVKLPLLLDIRKTAASAPSEPDVGSNVLAGGALDAAIIPIPNRSFGVPRSGLTHVDISSFALPVTAGDVLAIVLRSDDPGLRCCGLTYSWLGNNTPGQYNVGSAFVRVSGGTSEIWTLQELDNAFRTYVNPIPEPHSVALAVFGIAGAVHRFRRHDSQR